jgi:hypothetical protein
VAELTPPGITLAALTCRSCPEGKAVCGDIITKPANMK